MSGSEEHTDERSSPAQWIVDIGMTLQCMNGNDPEAKTGSICSVPDKIRGAKDKRYMYRPQFVAMGPIHRGTRTDLQIMEENKWRYMHKLLSCSDPNGLVWMPLQSCCEAIKGIEGIIRASYGEKIDMAAEEHARIMLLDACFFLELLLKLTENEIDPSVDNTADQKKMLRPAAHPQPELASLLALSGQIGDDFKELSPRKIAESLFGCNVASADFSKGVYHFLHLIHLALMILQQLENGTAPLQLQRCAGKLQAFGITLKASQTNVSQGKNNTRMGDSVLRESVDRFEFKIEFNESARELIIPVLHIKEATEVKWRNLIAWEQTELSRIGYNFTSCAYFFKGLVCCAHDIQLLKDKGVIRVHKEAKDEDLVIMFQSITTGAERKDARYEAVCEGLNKAKVNGVAGRCVLVLRMPWHYGAIFSRRCVTAWLLFLEWLRRGFKTLFDIYLGSPWKCLGVVVGAALLALPVTQTIYAIRARDEWVPIGKMSIDEKHPDKIVFKVLMGIGKSLPVTSFMTHHEKEKHLHSHNNGTKLLL
ncbi:uncharacterized protein LOC114722491 [Neltuma alba]|uniref:uncharacterized protein LOC114722491 n=1 Tax=Neltuma alba TaxID=207710 RepID=UPI0010A32C1B|nr:uncharacterized protein LOC114722491 [Prosopis alba]